MAADIPAADGNTAPGSRFDSGYNENMKSKSDHRSDAGIPGHGLEELLLESTRLANRIAQASCHVEPETGESCAWYHGFLPSLRLLGLVATPAHHRDFFVSALGLPSRAGQSPRILVSGAADHYMLAQVWRGCRQHGLTPRITVVDLCETPLALNRWYAERMDFTIETQRADLLDYDAPGAFDFICTHSLLGRFSQEQRPQLMAGWLRLAAPGGRVVTVNRVRVEAGRQRVGFESGHAQTLHATVLEKARRMSGQLDQTPETLAERTDAYSERHRVHPVKSREEMENLFRSAGFGIEQLSMLQAGSAKDAAVSGPTLLDGSHYACIVARAPA